MENSPFKIIENNETVLSVLTKNDHYLQTFVIKHESLRRIRYSLGTADLLLVHINGIQS